MGGDPSQPGVRHGRRVCQSPRSRRAGCRGQCCTPCCPAGGPERAVGPGRAGAKPSGIVPAPSRAFPPPHVPAAPLASHCINGPAPPRCSPPANGRPVARQRAHLNGPIRRPSPSPSLYGDREMSSLIRPPATAGCPAHSLREAPPTPA